MKKIFLLTLFSLFITTTSAYAKTGKCLLEVNGKTYINGPCYIKMDDSKDGSFTINVADKINKKKYGKHFVFVTMYPEDTDDNGTKVPAHAEGFWNDEPEDTHAQTPLGTLKRNGACWENETARVCAYK